MASSCTHIASLKEIRKRIKPNEHRVLITSGECTDFFYSYYLKGVFGHVTSVAHALEDLVHTDSHEGGEVGGHLNGEKQIWCTS